MNGPPNSDVLPAGTGAGDGDAVRVVASTREHLVFREARVFKTGNSLAIRIPSAVAKAIGLEEGSAVDMAVGDGMIWLKRSVSRNLADLIARITPANTHVEQFHELTERERW